MLTDDDRPAFAALLREITEFYDREPMSGAVMRLWLEDLRHLPLATIRGAFAAHRRGPRGSFVPRPADLLAMIAEAMQERDGHPGGDEAWSIAIQAHDEGASVVWTDEIQAAYFAAAVPLLDEGDKIAARRAFLDRYGVELARARRSGAPAKWIPSLGTDTHMREAAVQAAVQAGRISHEQAAHLLPSPAPTPAAVALLQGAAARLAGPAAARAPAADPNVAREAITALRALVRRAR
jgi:hypothetical protein